MKKYLFFSIAIFLLYDHLAAQQTGTAGNPVSSAPIVGDRDGGGVVAYIFEPGNAGYVAVSR